MAYTPIPAAASGGLPTDLTYNDTTKALLLAASRVGNSVTSSVQNTDNTNTSSHAYLRALSGGTSGGDAGVELEVPGGATWTIANKNQSVDSLEMSRGGLPYVRLDPTNDVLFFSAAGAAATADGRRIIVSHWNAASGIETGPAIGSTGLAGTYLNILPQTTGNTSAAVAGKGFMLGGYNTTASLWRKIVTYVHTAGPVVLKLNSEEGNVEAGTAGATTATDGYMCIGSCAGPPTGVPGSVTANMIALRYDRTNNRIYAYNGAWRMVAVA